MKICQTGKQGRTCSAYQLWIQFSMSKSTSNFDFLFAMDTQAGWISKSTKTFEFQLLLNPGDWFEVSQKKLSMQIDFWKFLTKVDLNGFGSSLVDSMMYV